MVFTRTVTGLGNQHLFYNVDAIVYVEGGNESWSKQDVYSGKYNDISIDIIYWSNLFKKFRSDLNLKFKAVGSKTTVSSIAIDIVNNNISTVIAAMDSEFDEIHNKKIVHNNIIYTKGYSWENDVWDSNIIISVLQDISGQELENQIINTSLDKFFKSIKIGVYADAYLFRLNDSFFPRKGHMKCVNCCQISIPEVDKSFISTLLNQKSLNKSTLYRYGSNNQISPETYCFGHLYGDFCFQIFTYYSRVILGIKTLHKDLLERFAITKFIANMNQDFEDYYSIELTKYGA